MGKAMEGVSSSPMTTSIAMSPVPFREMTNTPSHVRTLSHYEPRKRCNSGLKHTTTPHLAIVTKSTTLKSLTRSRKSPPTCMIVLENVTANGATTERVYYNAVSFPTDVEERMVGISQPDPRPRLPSGRTRSLRRSTQRIKKSSSSSPVLAVSIITNPQRSTGPTQSSSPPQTYKGLLKHSLLSSGAHNAPFSAPSSALESAGFQINKPVDLVDLRLMSAVRRSIRDSPLSLCRVPFPTNDTDAKLTNSLFDLHLQDSILADRLGTYLSIRGYRDARQVSSLRSASPITESPPSPQDPTFPKLTAALLLRRNTPRKARSTIRDSPPVVEVSSTWSHPTRGKSRSPLSRVVFTE